MIDMRLEGEIVCYNRHCPRHTAHSKSVSKKTLRVHSSSSSLWSKGAKYVIFPDLFCRRLHLHQIINVITASKTIVPATETPAMIAIGGGGGGIVTANVGPPWHW